MASLTGRVLVVDPDPAVLTDLSTRIEMAGASAYTARSGDEGLRTFWDTLPDLVIVDILALGDAGERMCREMRRADFAAITPLVIHSPRYPSMSRTDVMRASGAIDYVVKQIKQEKLQALLEWALSARVDGGQTVPHEELDGLTLSPDTEGSVSLESGSLPYLLNRAEEERLSGVLVMSSGEQKRALLFESGLIVGASSNARVDQLERVLLAMRRTTPAQMSEVKKKASGGDLLPLLVFLGILHDDERNEVLLHQALNMGVSMFRATTGRLQFRRGHSIDCQLLDRGIRPTTLALIGLRKNPALLQAAHKRLERNPVVFSNPSNRGAAASRSLPLTRFERTVLGSVDGERCAHDLRALGQLAQFDIEEPLAILIGSGMLKLKSGARSGARKRADPPVPTAAGSHARGSFDRCPFVEVVGSLMRERATGTLTLEGPARRTFTLRGGEVVHATSDRKVDHLGRRLVTNRAVSQEALERALGAQRHHSERRVGSLLVEMGNLSPDVLAKALRDQVLGIFEETFSWTFGQYEFVPGTDPPEWSVRLDCDTITLLRRGTYAMSREQLWGRWGSLSARLVSDTTDATGLTASERELLIKAFADGGVAVARDDLNELRRMNLLVSAGFAHVVGALDLEAATEAETTGAEPVATTGPSEPPTRSEEAPAATLAAPSTTAEDHSEETTFEIVTPVTPSESERARGRWDRPASGSSAGASGDRADGSGRDASPGSENPTAAILSFLEDQLVGEKREVQARLRWTEVELRRAMEELGQLRERTRHLEAELESLRGTSPPASARAASAAAPWPPSADGDLAPGVHLRGVPRPEAGEEPAAAATSAAETSAAETSAAETSAAETSAAETSAAETAARKTTARKTAAKKTAAKKTAAKKTAAKKTAAKKATARKATARKAAARKAAARKAAAKKVAAKTPTPVAHAQDPPTALSAKTESRRWTIVDEAEGTTDDEDGFDGSSPSAVDEPSPARPYDPDATTDSMPQSVALDDESEAPADGKSSVRD